MDGETTTETVEDNAGAPEVPDFSEAISSMEANLKAEIAALKQSDPEPQDLVTSLIGEDEWVDDDEEVEYVDPATERLQALEDYIINEAAQKRTGELSALAEKHDDFRDYIPEINKELDKISTDEGVRTNPALVERIYLSLKAEADAEAETTAEEARSRGASLETDAAAGAPSEEDPDAEFKRQFAKATEKSVFG